MMRKIAIREIPHDLEIRWRWGEKIHQSVDKKVVRTSVQDSEAIFSMIERTCKFIRNLARVQSSM